MKKLILLGVIILSSACVSDPVAVKLPLPPPIELPRIPADELQCLSNDAYAALVRRDKLRAERISTLESIIRSTWK